MEVPLTYTCVRVCCIRAKRHTIFVACKCIGMLDHVTKFFYSAQFCCIMYNTYFVRKRKLHSACSPCSVQLRRAHPEVGGAEVGGASPAHSVVGGADSAHSGSVVKVKGLPSRRERPEHTYLQCWWWYIGREHS